MFGKALVFSAAMSSLFAANANSSSSITSQPHISAHATLKVRKSLAAQALIGEGGKALTGGLIGENGKGSLIGEGGRNALIGTNGKK